MQSLGPCRETRDQQHQYLLNLATRFQTVTIHALAARYGADGLFDRVSGLKLATAVVNRNTSFADVWKKGHARAFSQGYETSGNDDEHNEENNAEDSGEQVEFDDAEDSDEQSHPVQQSYSVRHIEAEPDLEDILHDDREIPKPEPTGIMSWLKTVYMNSRGFEMGTFDASLLPVIWREQSAHWDDLALGYVSDMVSLVHKFIHALISAICSDERVQFALMSILLDDLIDRYTKSIDHAKFIISVEKDGTPQTLNHYFADNLEKW